MNRKLIISHKKTSAKKTIKHIKIDKWKRLSLHNAGVVLIDCDHRTPPAAKEGYPYVTIPQIKNGRLDLTDAKRITRENYFEWTKKAKPREHDVVLSRRCNPGETAYVHHDAEFALGQNLVLLRANGTNIYPPFLRWLVRSPAWWIQNSKYLNVGAIFSSLKCADIPKFEFLIPPLPEQRAIAHVLGTLDDKIEVLRRMNKTLEEMARALFKSWFVDFDPVRAKMEGRWKKGQTLPGMPADTWDLWPDKLVKSESGMIPEGWETQPLYSLAKFINGSSFDSNKFSDEEAGLPIIKIVEIKDGITKQTKYTSEKLDLKYLIDDGDILLSWSGNPDTSIGTFVWIGGKGWLNQHIFNVEPYIHEDKPFIFYQLDILKPIFTEIARDKQTTGLGHFTVQDMKRIKILKLPFGIKEYFTKIITPVFRKCYDNTTSIKILTNIRDALLVKLISGELII